MSNKIINVRCSLCDWQPWLKGPLALSRENYSECYGLWFEHCQLAHGVDSEGCWPDGVTDATFFIDLDQGTLTNSFALPA